MFGERIPRYTIYVMYNMSVKMKNFKFSTCFSLLIKICRPSLKCGDDTEKGLRRTLSRKLDRSWIIDTQHYIVCDNAVFGTFFNDSMLVQIDVSIIICILL